MLNLPAIAPVTVLLIAAAYLIGSLSGRQLLRHVRGAQAASAPEPRRFTAARTAWDVGKGMLAAWLALRFAPVGDALPVTAHGYLAAFAAALGHAFPVWHRFRGGDATAPLVGGLLVLWPQAVAAWLIVGLLAWLASGHAGLSVVVGAVALLVLAGWSGADAPRLWFAVAAVVLVLLAHRAHLWRLWSGAEPRFARARRLYRWRRR